jgi:NTP pyrophosphatase (non-canonical NTP hydrolase)
MILEIIQFLNRYFEKINIKKTNKMKFETLNKRVIIWANNKGILDKATPLTQHSKTQEEVTELKEALLSQANSLESFVNSKGSHKNTQEEIEDAIGDVLVTIFIQCKLQSLNPLDCLETALNIIEKRNGKMLNGVFVKN